MRSKIFRITLTRIGMFPSRQRWEKKPGGRGPGGREIRVKDGHQLPNWTRFSYVCLQMNKTRQVNEYIN